jgi:ribosomal protein L19
MDTNKLDEILRNKYTPNIPNVKVGDTVKIVLKLKEKTKNKDKNKTQIIQGVVISHKHGKELGANITIRRILDGVGVE